MIRRSDQRRHSRGVSRCRCSRYTGCSLSADQPVYKNQCNSRHQQDCKPKTQTNQPCLPHAVKVQRGAQGKRKERDQNRRTLPEKYAKLRV